MARVGRTPCRPGHLASVDLWIALSPEAKSLVLLAAARALLTPPQDTFYLPPPRLQGRAGRGRGLETRQILHLEDSRPILSLPKTRAARMCPAVSLLTDSLLVSCGRGTLVRHVGKPYCCEE